MLEIKPDIMSRATANLLIPGQWLKLLTEQGCPVFHQVGIVSVTLKNSSGTPSDQQYLYPREELVSRLAVDLMPMFRCLQQLTQDNNLCETLTLQFQLDLL